MRTVWFQWACISLWLWLQLLSLLLFTHLKWGLWSERPMVVKGRSFTMCELGWKEKKPKLYAFPPTVSLSLICNCSPSLNVGLKSSQCHRLLPQAETRLFCTLSELLLVSQTSFIGPQKHISAPVVFCNMLMRTREITVWFKNLFLATAFSRTSFL